jgi:2-polyprenyl-6-methoxyphenol hydroxylase-like FAD-dependent oxidoreductase
MIRKANYVGKNGYRLFSTVISPDVCIVGGGPVGAALACALSKSSFFEASTDGKKIVIIDSSPSLPDINTYRNSGLDRVPEPRVVTLSPSSLRLLRSIGAFDEIGCDQRFVTPFKEMLVYEQAGSGYMRFNCKEPTESSMLVKIQDSVLNSLLNKE